MRNEQDGVVDLDYMEELLVELVGSLFAVRPSESPSSRSKPRFQSPQFLVGNSDFLRSRSQASVGTLAVLLVRPRRPLKHI